MSSGEETGLPLAIDRCVLPEHSKMTSLFGLNY